MCVSTALPFLSFLSSIVFCQAALVREQSSEQAEILDAVSGAWILTGSTGILLPAVGTSGLGRAETKSEVSGGASGRLH